MELPISHAAVAKGREWTHDGSLTDGLAALKGVMLESCAVTRILRITRQIANTGILNVLVSLSRLLELQCKIRDFLYVRYRVAVLIQRTATGPGAVK